MLVPIRRVLVELVSALLLAGAAMAQAPTFRELALAQKPRPKLVVVLSVDQMRADYLSRYGDLLLPATLADGGVGGFRYLMEKGAYFVDARQGHYPLFTGPGHAAILTGAYPSKHGIVANEWWVRDGKGSSTYCVDQPDAKVVGAASGSTAKPMGPEHLLTSTVGDELKLATAGHARVVSLAIKDRAAILMAGHAADVVLWFDASVKTEGHWVTSTAYATKLPSWLDATWKVTLPYDWTFPTALADAVRDRTFVSKGLVGEPAGLGVAYDKDHPHTAKTIGAFAFTPAASAYVLATAAAAVRGEKLGQGTTTDLLTVSLSSFDYAGHAWGPCSAETLDHLVATDAALSRFFNELRTLVPGGLDAVTIALTADHGSSPAPEDAQERHIPASRVDEKVLQTAVDDALRVRFGDVPGGWIDGGGAGFMVDEGWIYLNESAIRFATSAGRVHSRREVERVVVEALERTPVTGIYRAFASDDLLDGAAGNDLAMRVARGVHPRLSGDVAIVQDPFSLFGPGGPGYTTSHGTPYVYDGQVPLLLAGAGIAPGVYTEPVEVVDLAPTLSAILGIVAPSGSDGHLLRSALH